MFPNDRYSMLGCLLSRGTNVGKAGELTYQQISQGTCFTYISSPERQATEHTATLVRKHPVHNKIHFI